MLQEIISNVENSEERLVQLKRYLDQEGFTNINDIDSFGDTALHIASNDGFIDIVEILLSKGANPNIADKMGNTPLHLAALFGNLQIVTLLLNHGADINYTNDLGAPIHWAFELHHIHVISHLVAQGAHLHLQDKVIL